MGKLIIEGTDYGNGGAATISYLAERTVADEEGAILTRDYLKGGSFGSGTVELEEQMNAGFHNSFYRGKDIDYKTIDGTLSSAISTGSFEDLFIGDYFTVNVDGTSKKCIIAGFDTYLHNGDTELTKHHAVMVFADGYGTYYMNSSNSTSGGYVGSYAHKTVCQTTLDSALKNTFGDCLIEHKELLSSDMKSSILNGPQPSLSGAASSWAWTAVKSCLLTELEVTGSTALTSSGYDIGTGKVQLPLFRFGYLINGFPKEIWTRSIASSTTFVTVNLGSSMVMNKNASTSSIVFFPRFLINGIK